MKGILWMSWNGRDQSHLTGSQKDSRRCKELEIFQRSQLFLSVPRRSHHESVIGSELAWIDRLKKFSIRHFGTSENGCRRLIGRFDRRLDMLVSAAHELRSSWTTSEARCVEWAGLFITEANLDLRE